MAVMPGGGTPPTKTTRMMMPRKKDVGPWQQRQLWIDLDNLPPAGGQTPEGGPPLLLQPTTWHTA